MANTQQVIDAERTAYHDIQAGRRRDADKLIAHVNTILTLAGDLPTAKTVWLCRDICGWNPVNLEIMWSKPCVSLRVTVRERMDDRLLLRVRISFSKDGSTLR